MKLSKESKNIVDDECEIRGSCYCLKLNMKHFNTVYKIVCAIFIFLVTILILITGLNILIKGMI